MKRKVAGILEVVPGVIFWVFLIIATFLNLPYSRQGLVQIFITVLGVLLGFWSVTFPARVPKEAMMKPEETRVFRIGRFWIAYTLVCGIVTSLITYLFLETNWGVILLIVSAFSFYMGLCMFLWGCLVELGIIE